METQLVDNTALTLDDFLGHKTREKKEETKTTYLSGWRKKENARRDRDGNLRNDVTIWLHTRAMFAARWTHQWPKIVDLKKTQTRAVWSGECPCLETETTLKRQFKRDRETGKRISPPEVCPFDLMIEQVRSLVMQGKLKWTDELFKYEAGKDVKVLHAGGIYGAYSKPDLTPEQKVELAQHQIYPKEAWKENSTAKCSYVFRVVDNDHPEKGVQISVELDSVGDAMKRKLAAEIEGRGDVGNPMLHPYALQLRYYPDESDFRKKFDVIPMPRIELSDEIRHLITEVEPPSITQLTTPWNMKMLRASMEQHCLVELDWDSIFGPVEEYCNVEGSYQDPKKSKVVEETIDDETVPF